MPQDAASVLGHAASLMQCSVLEQHQGSVFQEQGSGGGGGGGGGGRGEVGVRRK